MNGPARLVISCAFVLFAAGAAHAQPTPQPVSAPLVTAETEHWYHTAEPMVFAGQVYDRAGGEVYFDGYEMVPSGQYKGVPLYSYTTVEPSNIVFVPLPGGLMQPYKRRGAAEIVAVDGFLLVETAEPATIAFPSAFDRTPSVPQPAVVRMAQPTLLSLSAAARTMGRAAPKLAHKPVTSRAPTANGFFVKFDGERWFSSGPATNFDPRTLRRVGELGGLPVYTARGRSATIFVPVAQGLDVVAPYSKRTR